MLGGDGCDCRCQEVHTREQFFHHPHRTQQALSFRRVETAFPAQQLGRRSNLPHIVDQRRPTQSLQLVRTETEALRCDPAEEGDTLRVPLRIGVERLNGLDEPSHGVFVGLAHPRVRGKADVAHEEGHKHQRQRHRTHHHVRGAEQAAVRPQHRVDRVVAEHARPGPKVALGVGHLHEERDEPEVDPVVDDGCQRRTGHEDR